MDPPSEGGGRAKANFQQKIMRVAKSGHPFSQSRKTAITLFAMPRRRRPSESKFSAENYARCKKRYRGFLLSKPPNTSSWSFRPA
jgi:hypothetical protein